MGSDRTSRKITVRDWRRRPPLRIVLDYKPDATWWWINCGRWGNGCNHRAAVAIAPYVIRWGPDAWAGDAAPERPVLGLRSHRCDAHAPELGRVGRRVGAFPRGRDGAGALDRRRFFDPPARGGEW